MHPRLNNLVKIGTLSAPSDESGGAAKLQVKYNDQETHGGIPHLQSFGLVSVPVEGARVATLCLNHDNSNKFALGVIDPTFRPTNLNPGETQLHDNSGQSVYLANGGTVSVAAGKEVKIIIGGTVVLDLTASACTINVPLTVQGTITASGDIKAGSISLEQHTHGGVTTGSGRTGTPA